MGKANADSSRPYIRPAAAEQLPESVRAQPARVPLADSTLGDLSIAARVAGPSRFDPAIRFVPYQHQAARGLDTPSVRMFRYDGRSRSLAPVWNSGINVGLGYAWAK